MSKEDKTLAQQVAHLAEEVGALKESINRLEKAIAERLAGVAVIPIPTQPPVEPIRPQPYNPGPTVYGPPYPPTGETPTPWVHNNGSTLDAKGS